MTPGAYRRSWIVLAFLGAVAALSAGIWLYGYRQALDQLAQQGEADLALASDRLGTQLRRSQELAVLMADHPAFADLSTAPRRVAAGRLLLEVADKTSVLDIMFADASGRVIVAAEGLFASGVSQTAYFRRAMQGALGSAHGIKAPLDKRAYYHAAPVFAPDGAVRGALVVAVDVDQIESTWRGSRPAVFFTDAGGEVFISNRSELLFWTRPPGGPGLSPPGGDMRAFSADWTGPHEVWTMGWGPYLPDRALHLARDLPVIGLTAEVLVDVAPARRIAGLLAATVAAMCLAFGALLFLATERRRTLARANAVLESRVAERTRALSATNARLRREVAERQEAESALKRAQADLVQAGKLSALGQMSAGISHELNQPLMAIQSFAENGAQFLAKGRADMAGQNLGRISDLAHRMGRIIKNLRAFARQESEAPGQVDIVAAIDEALDLVQPRLARDDVILRWDRPAGPVWVAGGSVRLGQVFVNLVNNAADAMAAGARREIDVRLTEEPDRVLVEVADTGPGIAEPEKMFDPFYTTKEVGASEGMGLGLSISYGLVQSFGGAIRGRNREGGGAVLTVELAPWRMERVA
jgi:two-component system C4-dicarboxylate transport sensor histidine kinase DctB